MKKTSRRYRGSRRSGVGIIIPVLIMLCIIAAGALYIINDNMTFTKDGSFFSAKKTEIEPEKVEANLIIEEADPSPESQKTELAETALENPDLPEKRAVFIPIGSVKSAELFEASLAQIVADAKVNTVVLEVKAEDGNLAFASESPLASAAAVSGDDAILAATVASAKEKGYKVALLMSCFRDNEVARKNQAYSVRTANKIIWLDGENMRWLSAYSSSAQEYLLSAVKKLSAFAPDEIILSNISFPAFGKTEILAYEEELGKKSDMLRSFIEDAKEAAGQTQLSAVYENYNENVIEESGQNEELFEAFETLYIAYNAGKYSRGFAQAEEAFKDKEIKLVPITTEVISSDFLLKK